jgi:hypothetical protein
MDRTLANLVRVRAQLQIAVYRASHASVRRRELEKLVTAYTIRIAGKMARGTMEVKS